MPGLTRRAATLDEIIDRLCDQIEAETNAGRARRRRLALLRAIWRRREEMKS